MLTNLFSIFDPSSSMLSINMAWLISPILMVVMSKTCKISTMTKNIMSKISKELNQILKMKNKKSKNLFLCCWLMMILQFNLLGLIPFSFTLTAQIMMSFPLAMSLWLSIYSKQWVKNTKKSLAHLVPSGAPFALSPVLVMIELISSLIRPITLSVRLSANMMAGHLMMSLLANGVEMTNSIISMNALIILSSLEIAVAAIQAYVFVILISLYDTEV